tara:strand:+ start:591 stop:824 length:234 start_codon:yes stop_codon:yes gene_type:complete
MSEIWVNILITSPMVLVYYCTYLRCLKHKKKNESKQPKLKAKQNYVLGDVSECGCEVVMYIGRNIEKCIKCGKTEKI